MTRFPKLHTLQHFLCIKPQLYWVYTYIYIYMRYPPEKLPFSCCYAWGHGFTNRNTTTSPGSMTARAAKNCKGRDGRPHQLLSSFSTNGMSPPMAATFNIRNTFSKNQQTQEQRMIVATIILFPGEECCDTLHRAGQL